MPFDEYLCIAAATVEGQRLQELGLFDLFFAKWPSGTELPGVAAKEAVLNLTEPTKKFSERLKSAFEGDTTFMDAGMVVSAKVQSRKISIAEEETDGGEGAQRDDEQEIVRGELEQTPAHERGCVAGCWPNAPNKRSQCCGSGENQERDDAIVS